MFEYDEENLREVAEALLVINPHISGWSVEALVEHMKRTVETAYSTDKEFGYIAIYGYVLTVYQPCGNGGKLGVKASLAAYTVNGYLKSLKKESAL